MMPAASGLGLEPSTASRNERQDQQCYGDAPKNRPHCILLLSQSKAVHYCESWRILAPLGEDRKFFHVAKTSAIIRFPYDFPTMGMTANGICVPWLIEEGKDTRQLR
jgi:hypothetical protein